MDEKIQKIIDAIRALKPEDFTKGGPPKVESLDDALGFKITSAERDEAWAVIEKERKKDSPGDDDKKDPDSAEKKAAAAKPSPEKTIITGEDVLANLRKQGRKI